jgi:hypothetical protein
LKAGAGRFANLPLPYGTHHMNVVAELAALSPHQGSIHNNCLIIFQDYINLVPFGGCGNVDKSS